VDDSTIATHHRRRYALTRASAAAFAGVIALSAVVSGAGPASGSAADTAATRSASENGSLTLAALADFASTTLTAATFTTDMSRRILGRDGRFTILLLGSDSRPSHPGIRTDTIVVASVDPVTRRAAAVSIPRDTVNFPLSGGRTYRGKINALYQALGHTTRSPGTALRKIVGSALGIEIDAYVVVGFDGFRKLVNNVRGLDVYVARSFYDSTYSIRRGHRGFGLTRGWHHLVDLRALAFARTRHADSDYARARRQQQLIVAAVGKVRSRGLAGLTMLLTASRGLVKTDLPLSYAPLIFAMVSRADVVHAHQTVFGPRAFALSIGGYNNVLRLAACRAWIRRYFPPTHANGAWLPPFPTPSPTPSPAPSGIASESPSTGPSDSPAPSASDSPSPSPSDTSAPSASDAPAPSPSDSPAPSSS
jgi:LCP family protein required for cell wall assembly